MFLKNTSLQYTEESVLHNIIHQVPERNNIVVYLLLMEEVCHYSVGVTSGGDCALKT